MGSNEQVNQEIKRAVLAEWETSRRPLLISQLGTRLKPETKSLISETGHGLKRYIQDNLKESVRFLPMKSRGGAVAPLDETKDLKDDEIESYYRRSDSYHTENIHIPKYWGDVWRGFQNEMPADHIRYIVIDTNGRPEVRDAPAGAALPPNAKVIDRTDIVFSDPGEVRAPRNKVHQSIENWCLREGLPIGALKYDRPALRNLATSSDSRGVSLMKAMDLLSRDELARISIPADLVLAMLERSGSR